MAESCLEETAMTVDSQLSRFYWTVVTVTSQLSRFCHMIGQKYL